MVYMAHDKECINEKKIDLMREDIQSIKLSLGYKEKYNGEFRQEVTEIDKNLNERLATVETEITKISTSMTSLKWLLALVLPVFAALLVEILIKM